MRVFLFSSWTILNHSIPLLVSCTRRKVIGGTAHLPQYFCVTPLHTTSYPSHIQNSHLTSLSSFPSSLSVSAFPCCIWNGLGCWIPIFFFLRITDHTTMPHLFSFFFFLCRSRFLGMHAFECKFFLSWPSRYINYSLLDCVLVRSYKYLAMKCFVHCQVGSNVVSLSLDTYLFSGNSERVFIRRDNPHLLYIRTDGWTSQSAADNCWSDLELSPWESLCKLIRGGWTSWTPARGS